MFEKNGSVYSFRKNIYYNCNKLNVLFELLNLMNNFYSCYFSQNLLYNLILLCYIYIFIIKEEKSILLDIHINI